MIDNASLLIGIAFSGASLVVALVIGWLNSRTETYLVHGAAGIGLVVLALAGLGLRQGNYAMFNQLIPFAILLAGLISIYSKKPSFDFGGTAEATYGNYDFMRIGGSITGPISDTIARANSCRREIQRNGRKANGNANRMIQPTIR